MRLLRKDAISYELDKLGFPKSDFSNLENAIMATQGLILVTGPTEVEKPLHYILF